MPLSFLANMAAAPLLLVSTIDNAHVVFDSGMVLVFDDEASSKSLDTRHCYNAVVNRKVRRKIYRIKKLGKPLNLNVRIIRTFFHNNEMAYNVVGHYTYHGAPVPDFCEKDDLIVITGVR